MEHIIAVERNYDGDIISFKTSNGRVISYRKALMETQDGIISGIELENTETSYEDETPTIIDTFSSYPTIYE